MGQCELTKLLAPNGQSFDQFAWALSLHNDVFVAGAWGVDAVGDDAGAAFIFRRVGGEWSLDQDLLASDGAPSDGFGWSVAIDGDRALIGAPLHNGPGAVYAFEFDGVDWVETQKLDSEGLTPDGRFGFAVAMSDVAAVIGAPGDVVNGLNSGSAFIFLFDGSQWIQQDKLTADDGEPNEQFGFGVAIEGDVAVIGAWLDDESGFEGGSAYIYRSNGEAWDQEQKLLPDPGANEDHFGASVDLSGPVTVISAHRDADLGESAGAAYVFRHTGRQWALEQKLFAHDAAPGDAFGVAAIDGETIVVGANSDDDAALVSGSAYIFQYDDGVWTETAKLRASDAATADHFGWAVAIDGETTVIGALTDDNGTDTGAAYVFDLNPPLGDLDCDGEVSTADLILMLGSWGVCDDRFACAADLDADGVVDGGDLLILLGNWG